MLTQTESVSLITPHLTTTRHTDDVVITVRIIVISFDDIIYHFHNWLKTSYNNDLSFLKTYSIENFE